MATERLPWTKQRSSGQLLQIYWWQCLNIDSVLVEDIVKKVAANWDELARKLPCSEAPNAKRFFSHADIDGFSEESRNTQRCRKMLTTWLKASASHNVGALFNGLQDAGYGRLADDKLNGSLSDHVDYPTPVAVSSQCVEETQPTVTPVPESGASKSPAINVGIDFKTASPDELDTVYEQLEMVLEVREQRALSDALLAGVGNSDGAAVARSESVKYRCSLFRATMNIWTDKADQANGHTFLNALQVVSLRKARQCRQFVGLGLTD